MILSDYWRINVTADNGNINLCIAGLEFRATIGGADQCTGGTPLSNEYVGGWPASNAFDNNPATAWASNLTNGTGWLGYAFAAPVSVEEISIRARADVANTAPKDFNIEYSVDSGVNWIIAKVFTDSIDWAAGEVRTFAMGADSAAIPASSYAPLVEILSSPPVADIPFKGLTLSGSAAAESEPFVIALSDNSLVVVHISGSDLTFIYTDPAGTVFNPVQILLSATLHGVSCCELTSGNIGLIYFTNSGGNYNLCSRIVTPTGLIVSTAVIASWANTVFTSHSWIIRMADDSYLLVYAKAAGTDYHIYQRTSSDFVTWSAESALSLTGFTATQRLDNPSLCLLASGELQLWLDYADSTNGNGDELSNIYLCRSLDSGATWAAAVKVTDYSVYSTVGRHPVTIETTKTEPLRLIYTEESTLMEYETAAALLTMQPNPVDNTVVLVDDVGTVTVLDIVTWAVVDQWTAATIPEIDPSATPSHTNVPGPTLVQIVNNNKFIDVLDTATDTITHYNLVDFETRTENVTFSGALTDYPPLTIKSSYIDEANMKLWLTFVDGFGLSTIALQIGYIDLTDVGPNYTINIMVTELDPPSGYMGAISTAYYPADDLVIAYRNQGGAGYSPMLHVFNISTNSLYKDYSKTDYPTMPYNGIHKLVLYDNCIFGLFNYSSEFGETDRRGIVKIDLLNDAITYHRPTWASIDEYQFEDLILGATGELILSHYSYGVTVYNIAEDSWQLYDGSNVPGLLPHYSAGLKYLAYDATHDYIFVCGAPNIGFWDNMVMFPGSGSLRNAKYYSGALVEGVWTFTSQGRLTADNNNFNAVAVTDPNSTTSLYAFWETAAADIHWGKDGSSIDISPYLLCDEEISIERSITGTPHRLSFSCSDGHLFDTHNSNSALRGVFAKGRKLTARWGLKVDGVDTWTNAGTFYVNGTQVAYERGVYSAIRITAEDMRSIWSNKQIYATDYYDNYPEEIITDLVGTFANIAPADIDLPVFNNRITLEHQWLETPLEAILTQLCDRFGYFLKITVDNTISAGRISDANTIDNVYTNAAAIIRFEPDDSFSDFTNRVTVIGQEKTYIEVSFPEERVATKGGTVGWYGFHNDYHIPYSEDESRTCVNPRLHVVESVTSIGFKLSGSISERISHIDPDNKYCTLTVEAPDLTPLLITALASLLASQYAPDFVTSGGSTIRVGSRLTAFFTWTSLMILAASGNFQYEIWATPKGRIRRTLQSSADDIASQQELGYVVERKLEDPLCYTTNDCQYVAANELLVVRLQRRRVKLLKIANYADEEGHTIQLPHPYTGVTMTVFITDLKRSYVKPSPGNDGGVFDQIEGWVL